MTLLNGLLAFGAAAFTIPLVIHLLHRSRYQTIDWGAMHLLQSSRNVNSRRVQWQQLLLLLLRCALPVLLALAMARPLLQSFLSPSGQSAMSLALVIDDSMSMFSTDNSNATRFSVACKSAAEILNSLPPGSNAIAILGGAKPEILQGQIPDELANKLIGFGKRTCPAGEFTLEESIRSSLEWLSKSQYPRRQVVLISDFQPHEWSDQKASQFADIAKLFAVQPTPPELAFIAVGPNIKPDEALQRNNLFVRSVDVSSALLTIDRKTFISTSLGNSGRTRSDNVGVAVFVDDVEIDRQEISFAPNSTTQMRTSWSPKRTGDHAIRVQILREDDLIPDNRLEHVVIVQETIPILLVDGDRRNEAMQSETDFLRLALSPFSLLTSERGDTFVSKTIQPNELNESILKTVRTVCLCNVREVSEVQQNWLRAFVEQGNGLIVFLGDKIRTEHYESWPTPTNNGLRIAKFQSRTKIATDQAASGQIKLQQINFAPIRELSSASLNSLADVRFEFRSPIALDSTAVTNPSDASVAMRFDDDQAWILESRIGTGRCLWISTACDDDDSNLPTRSIFVPLVQKLLAYASNANPPDSNSIATNGWSRSFDSTDSKSLNATEEVQITKPDGTVVAWKLTADRQLRFADTRLLGTYSAKCLQSESSAAVGPILACSKSQSPQSNKESSTESNRESELTTLTSGEISTIVLSGNATVSASSSSFLASSKTDWHGREIWTWIWTALVVCFLAEMAVEQSLSPRVRSKRDAVPQRFAGGPVA
jgi:hypothetical protein